MRGSDPWRHQRPQRSESEQKPAAPAIALPKGAGAIRGMGEKSIIRKDLQRVPDHRVTNVSIPLDYALMSAFAMFSLKDPSLLAFDNRRHRMSRKVSTAFTAWG
jgi:hypothetical protein